MSKSPSEERGGSGREAKSQPSRVTLATEGPERARSDETHGHQGRNDSHNGVLKVSMVYIRVNWCSQRTF